MFTNLSMPVRSSGAKHICRYKYISVMSKSAGDGSVGKSFSEKNLRLLALDEADIGARAGPDNFPSQVHWHQRSSRSPTLPSSAQSERYSFGYAFCGGGGVSCGAMQAGLSPIWAFDHTEDIMYVYDLNFHDPRTLRLEESAECFSQMALRYDYMVNVMHASPP
jgi:hypothetical protein